MKIRDHRPIQNSTTGKPRKSSNAGAFQNIFDAELKPAEDINDVTGPISDTESDSNNHQTWQTLQDSLALLDQAMRHLESGEDAPVQLLNDIEALRAEVRRQSATDQNSSELRQADTILAVEAARIRSLNH